MPGSNSDGDMRIRLAGDHSAYHAGSAAAFAVIRAEASRHGTIVETEDYDVLVVNGEGSMHHNSTACRRKIQQVTEALVSRRKAVLINSLWQANSPDLSEAIRNCSQIVVREILSQRELRAQGVEAGVGIDQSYFCEIDESVAVEPDDRAATTDFYAPDFGRFVRVRGAFDDKYQFLDMQALSWSALVRALRAKPLLLTGRHHAVYAACRAGTPFLALRGNSHKIEGLIATAGVSIPVFDTFAELQKNLDWPRKNQDAYQRLFDWMEQQKPWTLGV